ncbi:MAG: oligosaccharide flippase family protein [Gemmatimonadaceae bacterium]|nr:oligosaccharide flippase family protein [Gemmatimonadaceae bacterium]
MEPRLRTRLLTGTAWNLIATIFNQGSTFIANIILARMLGRDVFGECAIVQSTLLTTAGLVQLGTGYTATKFVAEFRSHDPEKAGRILGLCAVLSVAMASFGALALIILAPWLASNALDAPRLVEPLMLGIGFLVFSAINGYQIGALAGMEAYRSLAGAGILSGVTALVVVASGASQWGLNGAVLGLSVSAGLRCLFHMAWLKVELRGAGLRLRLRGFLEERTILLRFALPAAMSGYTALPALWLANTFLVRQLDGYRGMALYSAAYNLMVVVLFMPVLMNNVVMSIINQQRGVKNRRGYSKMFRGNLLITGVAACVGGAIMAIGGPYLLGAFGKDFSAGLPILYVLLASSVFEAMTIAFNQALQSHGRMWRALLFVNLPRDACIVICAFLLVPAHGAVGLALAYAIGRMLGLVSTAMLARWTLEAESRG